MKGVVAVIALILGLSVWSCDNVSSPPPNPSAKAEKQAREAAQPEPTVIPEVTREDMIETYNMIVELRNKLHVWKDTLDPMLKSNDPYFAAKRDKFRKWVGGKAVLIKVREERISPETHHLTNDHPAVSLMMAFASLKRMMSDYINFYYLKQPMTPGTDEEMRKWLDDFQKKMPNFTPSPPVPQPESGATF